MVLAAILAGVLLAAPAHARERAPGAPGEKADWASADKQGFGTSATRASRVWFTLRDAELTEVYYPDLSEPSARHLKFMVDGRAVTTGTVTQETLTYTQTSETAAWRLIRTYVTDPERATVLIKVRFESKDGKDHDVELEYDPQLSDDVGWTRGHALLAHDRRIASALVARPALTRTSSGYAGRTEDLLEHTYDALRPGNVVQQAHTRLTGRGERTDMTVALAFAQRGSAALDLARASLNHGFDRVADAYKRGWLAYRNQLEPIPAAAVPVAAAYETSLLILKAHEDKANPGAFVASPSTPWQVDNPYHRVRGRDLYHVATALLAAGDEQAADRALDVLFAQQREDGSFPHDSRVDGRQRRKAMETGLPLVLAHQLGRTRPRDWRHVRAAADRIVADGPSDAPATIAAEIAGLVCAADSARRNGDARRAAAYLRKADAWAGNVKTVRVASFLELVRLGVKRADDPAIVSTLEVVDERLGAGAFWRRSSSDRYGERRNGAPWRPSDDRTLGRAWPVLTGERGEYELLAGRPAAAQLAALASAGNDGGMLPEQVWDGRDPTGRPGFVLGEGTFSATPLAWSHAQLIRLAWSAEAGTPVERPKLVADRYAAGAR